MDVDEEKQHEMPMPVIPDSYDDDDNRMVVLLAVAATFPEMVRSSLEPWDLHYYAFSILSVVWEENDDDPYLVVNLPKKVVHYKFNDKSLEKLNDFARVGT
ncbi:hypothetical protein EZV62_005514 [Acer yangbiense]|uniref:Uncharacterized protein n=1 Tax=Acer yangbiense TaxID=1000413 RepID=A0A5C7IND3_9ROSI|nr:hypothetical protein EZV62_005514 [Acer yangbiense]